MRYSSRSRRLTLPRQKSRGMVFRRMRKGEGAQAGRRPQLLGVSKVYVG